MPHRLLLISVLLLTFSARVTAQSIRWNSAPPVGFVFQISNDEAQRLLTRSRPDTLIRALLHTQIDTFNVRKGWIHRPAQGHFILATIVANKLHCQYTGVFPYQVLLLKEYNALSLQVLDRDGNVREDARVKFKTRRIRLDKNSKTYRIENQWISASSKVVTVELDGFRSVFHIDKHEAPEWSNDYDADEGPDFYSYMITDKNKYKPGERVRFKSYALTGSRQPVRKDLEVWLMKAGKPVRVGTVSPHRPGSFAGEFYLHDSLRLTLDQSYGLQLRDKKFRVVSTCTFRYEDYELHGNKLEVTLQNPAQFHPAPNQISITATSDNGLPLKDARATVTIITDRVREVFQPLVVLTDTLMRREIMLDDAEPTRIDIPSALFQKANVGYHVHVSVVNSQNQRMEHSVAASHYFSQYEITAIYEHDSVVYRVLSNGVALNNVPMMLYRNGATEGEKVILPYREKINPALVTLHFQGEQVSRTFQLESMLPWLEFAGGIQKDSFNISINNPQQVAVSWYIYRGAELLDHGFGTALDFKSKIEDRSTSYYAELLYAFGGSDHIIRREFMFRESSLDVTLDVPDRVYPGQKVDATIQVTDPEGNPVSGVDLTALATTARLDYQLPNLPYYGGTSAARLQQATYTRNALSEHTAILDLDYPRWMPVARLDTMRYYQFTYPCNDFFIHRHVVTDSTQFAIYVMKNGMAKKVYVVEIDRAPVYYSWTRQPQAYSFYVTPNQFKQVTLRLYDRVLILDSLCFDARSKTIISFDLDRLPAGVKVYPIPPKTWKVRRHKMIKWEFTGIEIARHKQYLAAFRGTYRLAYLQTDEGTCAFVPLSAGGMGAERVLVGPIMPGMYTYHERGGPATTYRHTGGYSYAFEDNIVYKLEPPPLFPERLEDGFTNPMTSVNAVVINKEMLLTEAPGIRQKWHPGAIELVDHNCRVKMLLPHEVAQSGVVSVLFEDCNTGVIAWPCRSNNGQVDYFTLPRGRHHAVVLYTNGTYLKMDSVPLQSYRHIVADMSSQPLHEADSLSLQWLAGAAGRCFGTPAVAETRTRTLVLTPQYNVVGNLNATIFDEANQPMPGVSVVIKGTAIGTATDINGQFTLDIPAGQTTLVVSFIGYKTREIEVSPGSLVHLVLEPEIHQLSEVVVVGYGTSTERRSLSYSVSTLSGKVAGVSITREEAGEATGLPDREAEQNLYRELLTLKHLRAHFSDVGFWEPCLFTDRQGKATFTVTFPDDITRWDAVVYGMNRQLQTGTVRKSMRSYRPLMAELHVPQFLTVGDSVALLGKVLNYTADKSIQGKTEWTGAATGVSNITFDGYHTEKQRAVVASTDTLTAGYSFTRNDGYFDGEQRKVPVVAQGAVRANGTLSMLENNREVHLRAPQGSRVKVEIIENPLDIYAQDVQYLLHYKHDCNEQLASKLVGLLNHKLLMRYEGKPFDYDKDVNRIILRLLKNQNSEFLWSWWNVSPNTSYWMSAHILRALKAAQDAGYTVNLDIDNLVRKATYQYDFLHHVSLNDLSVIHALATWGAKIDYTRYVTLFDRQIHQADSAIYARWKKYGLVRHSMLNQKLLLLEVRQLRGLPFVRDSLLQYKKRTVLNEVYFADSRPSPYWYESSIPNNAIAYRIISRDSALHDLRTPMQMYFLSSRREASWNTYEASNVLMSILPDLITQGASAKVPAAVSLTGKVNAQITQFPYTLELNAGEELYISKDTGLPLYFMQYVEERVVTAQSGTDAFKITTAFSEKSLKAGKPTVLKATIEVKKDARLDHVMIEIPIPGGCSYADKRQPNNSVETHREYFKEKTLVFCENMTPGTYVFQVQLLPRFTGKYHVNPAQVSLMYFPVINANTALERVKIVE
jgi:hypothetical protein